MNTPSALCQVLWTGTDSTSDVPDAAKKKLRFGYDWMGRRISQIVSNYSTGSWQLEYALGFIYDGWNLLAQINPTNNAPIKTYMWGLDASGTPQRAGGVGGLLALRHHDGSPASLYFYGYDGNHNVATLTKSDGTNAAVYEYSAFGQIIRSSGPISQTNDFCFSTKRRIRESGYYYYYGYRDLGEGRWLTRDPIEETVGNQ